MSAALPEIETLARRLWGEPNREQSTRDDLRFGQHGSKSIRPKSRTWFDHETGEGGGYAALYLKVNGERPPDDSIVAVYDYKDSTGKMVFQVVRKVPKTFRQRRPDGNGGWIWNLHGVERVLYRLPELLRASPDAPVFVAEGEKDCDALRERGLIATTNPGGAGKWRESMSVYLQRRDVAILADNDPAGEAHAADVARKLHSVARSVRIVRLPGLPDKGDVSDWLTAGGTAEELERLAAAAPRADVDDREDPRPTSADYDGCSDRQEDPADADHPAPDPLGIWDAGEDDYCIPPRGWLLGTVFCRRYLSSVQADGGIGKTALRIAQLVSLAIGRSLTGEHVFTRCRVLLLSLEDDKDELRRRVYAVLRHYGITPAQVRGWLFLAAPKGLRLAEMKDGAPAPGALEGLLRQAIVTFKIDIISIDPFVKAHSMEENSNGAIDFVCTLLAKIAVEYDCAVDLPHHTKKGLAGAGDADRGRGASSMKDAARLVYTLTAMTTDEAEQFGIDEAERRSLIRLDTAKINIAPPSREARWFKLIGVPLDNGGGIYAAGDTVQTVEPWQPPDTWGGLDSPTLNRILDDIEAGRPDGSRFSTSSGAKERAAWRVIARHAPNKTERQAREIIKIWLKSGTLYAEEYEDATARKRFLGLRVNSAKRPS